RVFLVFRSPSLSGGSGSGVSSSGTSRSSFMAASPARQRVPANSAATRVPPAGAFAFRRRLPLQYPCHPPRDPAKDSPVSTDRINEYLAQFSQTRNLMLDQLRRVIVGQTEVIEQILAAVFTRGHCLLIGVPGLAKTLMVSSISQILDVAFKRIQFTPDLMPSDITGTTILEEQDGGRRGFRFVRGPIFTNVLLADEINRTPPKTQAALLQAMQERQVTVGQDTYNLDEPFFVIATQ